ncbi:F-box/FBD/LRR-repeat protein At1g13780-like isoform X1 [Cornus florida]|uniref:F-box/FBD/LRR-repeat protein At1g13780-like isoform X1 n=1 Tax=Cornus florida TaxID=4283 RepID=UPI0028A06E23|nr:F-box/FBD/LRR-repeat protein At1g13780-like isoform X1 [Cornus florida]
MVNAPILEYLTLQDDYLPRYVLKNLTSLVKADVNVGNCCPKAMEVKQRANRIFVILREIYSVKYLSLGARTMGALDYADDGKLLNFPNLIHLELHVHDCYGWIRLLHLLNRMPNLVYLVLEKLKKCRYYEDNASEDFNSGEQEPVPYCLLMHLQEIEINGFWGLSDELKLIEFFLRSSEVLRKMEINTSNLNEKQEREFLEKLLMFPRGSITSQILLSRKKIFAPAGFCAEIIERAIAHSASVEFLITLLPCKNLVVYDLLLYLFTFSIMKENVLVFVKLISDEDSF